ncbi:MAG: transposase family protein [Negativicutes bacterium]|nr:transposase family protein [Negativicutes bacterium]
MLSSNEIKAWMRARGYPTKTQEIILGIRSAPPSRRVQGGKGNISGKFSSPKMKVTIQFEGWAELVGVYSNEFDDDCLEQWDQPPVIPLRTPKKNYPIYNHHPDYFVIWTRDAGWVQYKRESELERIAEEKPWLYVKDETGRWRCPPGEEYAAQFGLKFWVKSERDYSWALIDNLQYLEDFFAEEIPVPDETRMEIFDTIRQNQGISTMRLLALLPGVKVDYLLALIAQNRLYVALNECRLSQPDTTAIFTSCDLCRAHASLKSRERCKPYQFLEPVSGAAFVWDGVPYRIINAGNTEIVIQPTNGDEETSKAYPIPREHFIGFCEQGKITGMVVETDQIPQGVSEILANASLEALQKANQRYKVISPIVNEGLRFGDGDVPDRTIRDWVRKFDLAEAKYGYGFVGLIDKNSQKGNYNCKLHPDIARLMEEVISQEYENKKQPTIRSVYGRLLILLEESGLPEVSYLTFLKKIRERKGPEQAKKRQGKRAAEQERPKYLYLDMETPRHGSYPMHTVHIDHTELDIKSRHHKTGKVLGRPWLTIAICTFTRRVIAFVLTFDPPSKRACMLILREIVRRNGRLPKWLVVDNGTEFGSVYFETTTALFECHSMNRPPGQPKFGSVCERIFGTANTQFVHNLAGNTQILKKVRIATKSHNPDTLATWSLYELHVAMGEYLYEVYDTIEHPALGQTPREAFAQGCVLHGYREHKRIPYNQQFLDMTLPTTEKGTAKVNPTEGVKINYHYYWSEFFRDGKLIGTQVPVRYDPFNVGIAKAWVNKTWVTCYSAFHSQLAGRSEKEIAICTSELKAQDTRHGRQFKVTSKKIAANIIEAESNNAKVAAQREKDLERERVLQLIHGGKSDDGEVSRHVGNVIPITTKKTATSATNIGGTSTYAVISEDW